MCRLLEFESDFDALFRSTKFRLDSKADIVREDDVVLEETDAVCDELDHDDGLSLSVGDDESVGDRVRLDFVDDGCRDGE